MSHVVDTISPRDAMFRALPDPASYLRAGKSVAHTIRIAADLAHLVPKSILDYGCGHGRVLRWYQAFWPEAELTAADITRDQIDFCSKAFGAKPFLIDKSFAEIALPSDYDLIWLGSIFTHMDKSEWADLFRVVRDRTRPGGLLCFSFAGRYVYNSLKKGDRFGFKPEEEEQVVNFITDYESSGFGFIKQNESNGKPWGRSLAKPDWVLDFCLSQGAKIVLFSEEAYARRQDIMCLSFR